MSIELINLERMLLLVGIEIDGTITVHSRGLCDTRAAAALRDVADRLEAGATPCPCTPAALRPAAVGRGWFSSDLMWVDSTGRAWDLRESYRSAGGLLWHWTGRVNEHGVPVMSTGTGSDVQSLDVVRALYAPLVVAGGRG
ncbi:phiSA1p31-related protein [Streptomyces sp. NPDC102283]|uniref:phiSA1p31-related protein n=1 Tax=Streptomyces sp. NPDC102283 TaxID=3366155 RepID=UPI0037F849E5